MFNVVRCSRRFLLFGIFFAASGALGSIAEAANLYASFDDENTVHAFSPTGIDLGVFASAGLDQPTGIAFDSNGNLYVASFHNNTIQKFGPTGNHLGVFANTGLSAPVGIAFDSSGNLYAANFIGGSIHKFGPTGTDLGFFAFTGKTPVALAFNTNGNLYVSDGIQNFSGGSIVSSTSVRVLSPTGNLLDTFNEQAGHSTPIGLAFDSNGDLLVADLDTSTINKFSPDGAALGTFASTGLNGPGGLAFDSSGNLFVANLGNNTIHKFGPTGTDLGTFAGAPFGTRPLFLAFAPVPEPSSLTLVGAAVLIIGGFRVLRRRRASE